ncbi:Wzz/FepE/Etk N-terminal domain-containing protein [Stackebrandtia nassauensis]|uniref:Lipopolysaccharide biosynthesis protein n=1 Tax=Stackebrandtia nassauensis (strain DSM 44728 / CIP 108903 / NRRL B-16338 / NBRC 102104 / LLR-40K-21) TaxID=446470 RepID=D3Q951_STANL|nr:Wzz/FepE/Etk N-terminal domain-containing protein [Stackebrandtia nassauensis]ADD40660.1 lipopolysaccharide biosynthesis protein [Stackebrandtia nassauensis DSM 44728]
MDAVTSSPGTSLGDLADSARRHRWLLVGATLLGVAAAGAYALIVPREYISTTSVLVQPTGAEESAVTGQRSKSEINLDTEAQLVTSTDVATIAADSLNDNDPVALSEQVVASVPANTSILEIGFVADEPAAARNGARAFAAAYLTHRAETARDRLSEQIDGAESDLSRLHAERRKLVERLDKMDSSDPDFAEAKKDRELVDGEIAELSANSGRWRAAAESVGSGRIISAARVPTAATSPHLATVLAAGALLGLLAGIGAVAFRRRFSVRLWSAADLPRRCGVDVLAAVPASAVPRGDDVFPAFGPPGRVFGKIRNEVAAALDGTAGIVIVAGVVPGSASSVVTANLAAAMARAGDNATVVSTHAAGPITVTSQLDTLAVPGLSDVLADRDELSAATHRAARYPTLDVIGPGGCATAAGPSREAMSELYTRLRDQSSYVVVDAAPMAVTAQAQSLATDADAVVLAVECGHDTARDVAEAVQAVRRVGARLLGAVVLPRQPSPRVDPLEVPSTEASHEDGKRRTPRPRRAGRRPAGDDTPTESLPRIEDEPVPAATASGDNDD